MKHVVSRCETNAPFDLNFESRPLTIRLPTDDDEAVWRLLRRFQILLFDFAAVGSQSEELAKERSVRALHRDHAS